MSAFNQAWNIIQKDYDSSVFELFPENVHGWETQSVPRFNYERGSRIGNPIIRDILDRFASRGYDNIVRDKILDGDLENYTPANHLSREQLDRAIAMKDVYDPDTEMELFPDNPPDEQYSVRLGRTRPFCPNAGGMLHEPLQTPAGKDWVSPPYLRHGEDVPYPLENYPYEWTDEHGNLHQRPDPYPGMLSRVYDPDTGRHRRSGKMDEFGDEIRPFERFYPRLTTEEMLERYGKLIADDSWEENGRWFSNDLAPSPDPKQYEKNEAGFGRKDPDRQDWMGDYNQRTQICPYCAPLPEGATSTYGHHNPNECPYLEYQQKHGIAERGGRSFWDDVLDDAGQIWDDEGYGILPFGGYRHHQYSPMEGGPSAFRMVMGDEADRHSPLFFDRDEQQRSAIKAGIGAMRDTQRATFCPSCRALYTPREKRDHESHSPRAQEHIDDPENNPRYYDTVSMWNPSFVGTGKRNIVDYSPATGRAGYSEVNWDPSRQEIIHSGAQKYDMHRRAGECPGCGGKRRFMDDYTSGDSAIRNNQYMQLRPWEDTEDLVEWKTGERPDMESMSGKELLDYVSSLGELPWTGINYDEDDDETPPDTGGLR